MCCICLILDDRSVCGFLQCCDMIDWVTRRPSGPWKNPCYLLFWTEWKKGTGCGSPRRKAIRTWWCGAGCDSGWHLICLCSFFWVVLLQCQVTHDLTFWTCLSLLPHQTTADCLWSLHTRVSDWTTATWPFSHVQDQVHLMIPAWLHSHE